MTVDESSFGSQLDAKRQSSKARRLRRMRKEAGMTAEAAAAEGNGGGALVIAVFNQLKAVLAFADGMGGALFKVGFRLVIDAHRFGVHRYPPRLHAGTFRHFVEHLLQRSSRNAGSLV